MESAVQNAARTLGLPEPVLEDFLSMVRSLRTWGDAENSYGTASGTFKLTRTAAKPPVNTAALFDALIDEYDRKL